MLSEVIKERTLISAYSVEEFKNIEEKLQKLPKKMTRISKASNVLVGLYCLLTPEIHNQTMEVYLPQGVTKILECSNNSIGIIFNEYFFAIEKKEGISIQYIFI